MSNDILTKRETFFVHTINMEDNDMLPTGRSETNEPTGTVTPNTVIVAELHPKIFKQPNNRSSLSLY